MNYKNSEKCKHHTINQKSVVLIKNKCSMKHHDRQHTYNLCINCKEITEKYWRPVIKFMSPLAKSTFVPQKSVPLLRNFNWVSKLGEGHINRFISSLSMLNLVYAFNYILKMVQLIKYINLSVLRYTCQHSNRAPDINFADFSNLKEAFYP